MNGPSSVRASRPLLTSSGRTLTDSLINAGRIVSFIDLLYNFWFMGTFHRHNHFYTVLTVYSKHLLFLSIIKFLLQIDGNHLSPIKLFKSHSCSVM